MPQITFSRAGALAIGELFRLTGVNIETIQYYEKVNLLPAPLRTEGATVSTGPARRERWLSSDARVNLVSHSMKSERCSTWEDREKHHVPR